MKEISIKSLYLIFIICIGLIFLGVGSTYAVFTASAEIESPITLVSNLTYDSSVLETIEVVVPSEGMVISTLNITNSSDTVLNYVVWYIDDRDDVEVVRKNGDAQGVIASGNSITIEVVSKNYSNESVTISIGISSHEDSIVLGSNMKFIPDNNYPTNLAQHISNMYIVYDKTIVTNNNIEYNYATEVNLMNDRLGGTTEDYDDGNIRYYGASPNNYIYFNCDDYNNQTADTCELWRIIGVFDDKVKIMRHYSIEGLSWDFDYNDDFTSTDFTNDWNDASLNVLLNSSYYENKDNVIYYYETYPDNELSSNVLNFATDKIGIKNGDTRSMISESFWYLGGHGSAEVFSDQIYKYERGTTLHNSSFKTSWIGKIALPYPSDYGYAGDFNYCTSTLIKYYDSSLDSPSTECRENLWMFRIYGIGHYFWLLTPSSVNNNVWRAHGNGLVYVGYPAYYADSVHPTLFLEENINVIAGDGTSTNPYKLSS